jgi:hypothetical protein
LHTLWPRPPQLALSSSSTPVGHHPTSKPRRSLSS